MYTRSFINESFPSSGSTKTWIFDIGIGTKYALEFQYMINALLSTTSYINVSLYLSNRNNSEAYALASSADIKTTTNTSKTITSVDINTDVFTLNSHGLVNGDRIYFTDIKTITGISTNTYYYIIDRSPNTFKISTTLGGLQVNIGGESGNAVFIVANTNLKSLIIGDANGSLGKYLKIVVSNTSVSTTPLDSFSGYLTTY